MIDVLIHAWTIWYRCEKNKDMRDQNTCLNSVFEGSKYRCEETNTKSNYISHSNPSLASMSQLRELLVNFQLEKSSNVYIALYFFLIKWNCHNVDAKGSIHHQENIQPKPQRLRQICCIKNQQTWLNQTSSTERKPTCLAKIPLLYKASRLVKPSTINTFAA